MIPVGGFYTIDADQAVKVINSIEPSIVLPMHFQVPNMEPSLSQNLKPVSEFLGKIGAKDVAPIEKLVVKKEDLSMEETKVIMLSI